MTDQIQDLSGFKRDIDDIANQLCQAIDGKFDFRVQSNSNDDLIQKLAILVNFVVDSAHRAIDCVSQQQSELERRRARHRTTLTSIGDGLISTDPSGRVEIMNPTAEQLTGWRFEDAQGRPIEEIFRIVNSKTGAEAPNPLARTLKEGFVAGLANDTLLIARDGGQRQIADSCAPIRDNEGRILGAVLVFRDVTEEYRQREQMLQSELRYRGLFSRMSDGVAVYRAVDGGQDFEFADLNDAGCRIDQVRQEDVIGRRVTQAFPGVERLGLLDVLRRVHATGVSEQLPARWYEDARIRGWRENFVYRLPANEVVAVYRDVSECKRAEAEQRELETQLHQAQKLQAVGQLAAGIAHEINTPAQFVGDSLHFLADGFANTQKLVGTYHAAVYALPPSPEHETLRQEMAEAEEDADLAYILESATGAFDRALDGVSRIAVIVSAMKEFAHSDQRDKGPADLNRALQTTLTIAKNEYKYVAEVETELGELPPVLCHIGDLNQVFLNLLVNAAHAIGDVVGTSGEKGHIRVRTAHEDSSVRIEISDTGAGIPEHIRERVFEPFFTTKDVGRGSGQGLAIARSIVVDKHGGSLTFDSTVGKGTTFTIILPLDGRAARATDDSPFERVSSRPAAAPASEEQHR